MTTCVNYMLCALLNIRYFATHFSSSSDLFCWRALARAMAPLEVTSLWLRLQREVPHTTHLWTYHKSSHTFCNDIRTIEILHIQLLLTRELFWWVLYTEAKLHTQNVLSALMVVIHTETQLFNCLGPIAPKVTLLTLCCFVASPSEWSSSTN